MKTVVGIEVTRGGRVRDMVVRLVNPEVRTVAQRCSVAASNPTGAVIQHASVFTPNLF